MDASKAIVETLGRIRQRRTAPLVLELDLTEGLTAGPPADPLSALLSMRKPRLTDTLDGLRRARRDPRVKALIVKIGGNPLGFATVQELRQAIIHFRSAGKRAIAFAETFGEFGPGTVPYYLATAFDKIYLQPSGDVGLTGLALEQRFYKGALDKLGVSYEGGQRQEYKTAPNAFTQDRMTEPHRESMARIAESVTQQIVAGIADGRRLTQEKVRDLIDCGPFIGPDAVKAGLVDRLAYRDEVYEKVRRTAGDSAVLLFVSRYVKSPRLPARPGPAVALIHGHGPIRLGRGGRGPLGGGSAMGSDSIGAAFRAARRDDQIKAVVLRVDTPGGSYVASDTIWREIILTRRVKPVIVSMGDVAASGGYFVATAADHIVAQQGTLTGSIGVFSGKPVLTDLLERVGVTSETIAEGDNAAMFSTSRGFSPEQWQRIDSWLDRVYDDFVTKVAEGRGLTLDRAHDLAKGRVWTGSDARESGLVDEIGGLEDALVTARRRAGLHLDAPVRAYPRVHPVERLRGPDSSEDRAAALSSLRLEAWGPFATLAAHLGLPPLGPLILPSVPVIR